MRAMLRRGMLPGALVFGSMYAVMLLLNGGFSVMGYEDSTLTDLVMDEYLSTVVGAMIGTIATSLVLGALLGILVAWTWSTLTGRIIGPGMGRRTALGVIWIHAIVWASHIRAIPQIHAETLYNRGGLGVAIQRGITHGLPSWVLPGLLWITLGLIGLATILSAWRARDLLQRSALMLILVPITVLSFSFIFGPSDRNAGTPSRPNILIIANDSMRPDHMGAYGYHRPTSPNLDAFSRQSVIFEDAYVPLARTFPSWASLLTGRLPHEHGIRHMFPRTGHRLDEQPTLPRLLGKAGYRTGVVADYARDLFTRMGTGFETIKAPDFTVPALVWQRVLQMQPTLLAWLDNRLGRRMFPDIVGLVNYPQTGTTVDALVRELRRGDGRPFFMVSFFSSSHFPYAAADPWYRKFVKPDYTGPNLYQRFRALAETEASLAADAEHLTDLFDGTISYFDDEFGRLIRALEDNGLMKNTIVIVTADHGEILFEHGTTGHGDHLRGRGAHRVPLLIRAPGMEPHRVTGQVRTIDLARTLLNLTQVEIPPEVGGVDLTPMLDGSTDDLNLLTYAETGLWFTPSGPEFYQHNRLPYPMLTELAELEAGTNGEISMKPYYEDRVQIAKHRAVWNLHHKVTYMPTPNGPIIEGWQRVKNGEIPEPPDPELLAELWRFLEAGGTTRVINGFAIPKVPVAAP